MRIAITWKMQVLDQDTKQIRQLYFCRVRNSNDPDEKFRYFGPSAAPDMPGYEAHKLYYPEQVTIRYQRPTSFSLDALKTLVTLAREESAKIAAEPRDTPPHKQRIYKLPSVTSSR